MSKRAALVRLDRWMVEKGLAASRQRAQELIDEGVVLVDGQKATKPATRIRKSQNVRLVKDDFPWVGRGALKLLGVLEPFGVACDGVIAADLGASTGGFTEVLLHHGAEKVYAIDVGKGQLAWKLRTHPQVINMEGVNARHLDSLPDPIDLIVGDLSFIGLAQILPTVRQLLKPGGQAVLLVKPQFEAGREGVSKGGIVRDPEVRAAAIQKVTDEAMACGFQVLGAMDSPLAGAKAGNVEHFLHLLSPLDTTPRT